MKRNKNEATVLTNDNLFSRWLQIYSRFDDRNSRDGFCGIVTNSRDSLMIDIPVVEYFGLTGGGVDVVSSVDASLSSESFVNYMLQCWS